MQLVLPEQANGDDPPTIPGAGARLYLPKTAAELAAAVTALAPEFERRALSEGASLHRLMKAAEVEPSEVQRLTKLLSFTKYGLGAICYAGTTQSRPRFNDAALKDYDLARSFVLRGAKAALRATPPRAGDFLNNQLRGQWAEKVVVSLSRRLDGIVIVPFGPSGAAMPGEPDFREVTAAFREISLVEGKRPDLLAFDGAVWDALTDEERRLTESWPLRLLRPEDDTIIRRGLCGIEVKNSTWHYGRRRAAGGSPLAITAKEEERRIFIQWMRATRLPVVFFQVLFDEMYCMSLRRMEAAIRRGYNYQPGDYRLDAETGGGGKHFHRFDLADTTHLCARVTFPSASIGHVRVLVDGSVVPYIEYAPIEATPVASAIVRQEITFGQRPA